MTPKRPRDPNQLAKSIIDIALRGRSLTAIPRQKSRARTRLRCVAAITKFSRE